MRVDCSWSRPSDVVFTQLDYKSYSLKDVSYIIYTSLLHFKLLYSLIEIKCLVWSFPQETDKCLGELLEAVFFASTPACSHLAVCNVSVYTTRVLVLHLLATTAASSLRKVCHSRGRLMTFSLLLQDSVLVMVVECM